MNNGPRSENGNQPGNQAERVIQQIDILGQNPKDERMKFPQREHEENSQEAMHQLTEWISYELACSRDNSPTTKELEFLDGSTIRIRLVDIPLIHIGTDKYDGLPRTTMSTDTPEGSAFMDFVDLTILRKRYSEKIPGRIIRFETSIGIDTEKTTEKGQDPMQYQAWVEKDGIPLQESQGPTGTPRHDTCGWDGGYGLGYRDIEMMLYIFVEDDATVSRGTFNNRYAEYRIAVARLNEQGNCLWKETVPFDLGRTEVIGG